MDLQALRKEVQSLPEMSAHLDKFQQQWLRPLRTNTNNHLPFLQNLNPALKKELKQKLEVFHSHFYNLKKAQSLQERMRFSLRQIVELKLTTLNGDKAKGEMIVNNLLYDDFVNFKNMIADVHALEQEIRQVTTLYDNINGFLQNNLPLEESLVLMELPHKQFLYQFVNAAEEQKKLVRSLGKHFLELAKETQLKKKK